MKKIFILVLLFSVFKEHEICRAQESNNLRLWYEKPASSWEEALPIGNGRLGAMIFGGTEADHIQFNEETLWTGAPHDYTHPGAYKSLGGIRELLWLGKQKEAEDLALEKFMSVPLRQEKYQPFGDLWLCFPKHENISGYRRELDISRAVCSTTFKAGDTTFTRRYIASFPDNVIAISLTSDRKKALSFDIMLTAIHEGASVLATEDGIIELKVKVKDGALFGTALVKVRVKGGKVSVTGNKLHIYKADKATVWLAAATNFKNPKNVSEDPEAICFRCLNALANK